MGVSEPPPLHGVRVLDLGEEISAPFCARLMARLGADVVKVERPGGDPIRRPRAGPVGVRAGESSPAYLYANEGKRGIVLDLETATGRSLCLDLVRGADVVVENGGPGAMDRLGLGFDVLREANPGIVLTSISAFGDCGPYRDYEARELTLFAMGGHMYRSGEAGRPPVRMGGHPTDVLAALSAAYATLAALHLRDARRDEGLRDEDLRDEGPRGAGGRHVTFSILESQVTSHAQAMVEVSYYGTEAAAQQPRGVTGIRGVLARDGLAMVSAQEQQMPRLAALVDAPPELGEVDPMGGGGQRAQLMERVAKWASQHTAREVYELGQAARVPASYVAAPQDLLESPQFRHRNFIRQVEHAELGAVSIPGLPFTWAGSEAPLRPAPRLGEHTVEVLEGLGLTRAEVLALAAVGVAG